MTQIIEKYWRGKTFHALVQLSLIGILTMGLIAGCSALDEAQTTPTEETRQPFSARRESEDGTIVSWGGYQAGFHPGEDEEFDLTIDNQSDQIWHGRFCLQLLSGESSTVLNTLAQREFNLKPGVGFSDTLQVTFPDTLDPGAYGLSLVVRRPGGDMVDLLPIQVGKTEKTRKLATQQDMKTSLEACEPVDSSDQLVEMARADLAERLKTEPDDIEILAVQPTQFPDASLGVPEEGKDYAQVIVPGFIIHLQVEDKVFVYHGGDQRVVHVPQKSGQSSDQSTPPGSTLDINTREIPAAGQQVVLPLHMLIYTDQPGEEVQVSLRWEEGTELASTFTTLESPEGKGLLIDSLDWQTETQPPQPLSNQAELIIKNEQGETLVQRPLTVLDAGHQATRLIDLYWLLGENLETEQRLIVDAGSVEAKAVEELLWGPPPRNLAGFQTSLPTPGEVLAYPGRQPDWGVRVKLLGFTLQEGTATVNFSQEMNAYGGGSARVQSIREQITRTLMQFPSVDEVIIAVEGKTEGVLQP
ncbi:MAG: GerMN domain-containing protein [Anaerolineales bacterium]|nr:GerMN domain-containing protein [Anaerolineales bacterium]